MKAMQRIASLALLFVCGCGDGAAQLTDGSTAPADATGVVDAAILEDAAPVEDAAPPVAADLADAAPAIDPTLPHARADEALERLLLDFWSGPQGYLNRTAPSDGNLTGYWTFAQAWDAALDGVERTQGKRFAGWIETLYLAQDARGWSSDYYDDESWMTLALIRAYDLTGDRSPGGFSVARVVI